MFRCLSPIVFTSGKCIFPVKQYYQTNRLVATSQILSGEMWVIPTQTAHDELDLKQFCGWFALSSPSFVDPRLCFLFDWLLTMSLSYLLSSLLFPVPHSSTLPACCMFLSKTCTLSLFFFIPFVLLTRKKNHSKMPLIFHVNTHYHTSAHRGISLICHKPC